MHTTHSVKHYSHVNASLLCVAATVVYYVFLLYTYLPRKRLWSCVHVSRIADKAKIAFALSTG